MRYCEVYLRYEDNGVSAFIPETGVILQRKLEPGENPEQMLHKMLNWALCEFKEG